MHVVTNLAATSRPCSACLGAGFLTGQSLGLFGHEHTTACHECGGAGAALAPKCDVCGHPHSPIAFAGLCLPCARECAYGDCGQIVRDAFAWLSLQQRAFATMASAAAVDVGRLIDVLDAEHELRDAGPITQRSNAWAVAV